MIKIQKGPTAQELAQSLFSNFGALKPVSFLVWNIELNAEETLSVLVTFAKRNGPDQWKMRGVRQTNNSFFNFNDKRDRCVICYSPSDHKNGTIVFGKK